MEKSLTRISCLLVFVAIGFSSGWAQPTISCPSVNAGPDQNLPCTTPCTNLTATNLAGFQTTAYTVGSIPYNPYSFTTGTAIIVNIDDVWGPVLPIPFNFCFYGNVYNQCVVGANGALSFNIANANAYNTWPIAAAIPTPNPADMTNCIMAPWHDIDPSVNQSGQAKSIKWATFGTAPCRTFVVSWYNIPMYGSSCNQNTSLNATQQIVLYETTNIIETYIAKKRTCTSWNGGYAIHGIQNAAGTAAVVVPGRNFPTQWTATNDAWRFVPAGPTNHTTTWYQVGNPVPVGNTPTVNVCPPAQATTGYYAQVVYTNCDNSTVTVRDTVYVTTANSITNLNPTVVQPSCVGLGSISLSPSGGTPGYTYNWSPGFGNVSSISNLPGGTYNVTVTDQAGCIRTQSFTLNPSTSPVGTINNPVNVACNGDATGSATVTVNGGTPNYSYTWNTSPVQTSQTATGLGAGSYSVTISDANGCLDTAYVTISQPSPLVLTIPLTQQITCNGASNGCLGAVPSGGNSNYSWAWSNGSANDTICSLPPGSYSVTLTDTTYGNFPGGFALCNETTTATITEPTPLVVNYTVGFIPCFGGTTCIASTASGGNGNYHFQWSNGSTLSTVCNLPAGTYTVTVTDTSYANNLGPVLCSRIDTITIAQPTQLTSTITGHNVTCNGAADGNIVLTHAGGTPGFTANWSNGMVGDSISGLVPGTYTVTLTDANGCTNTHSVTITQPAPIIVNTSMSPVSCFSGLDGCAYVTASGGPSGTFTYQWSNGSTNDTVCGLTAGTYYVTVTDTTGGANIQNVVVYNETFDPAGAWTLNVPTGVNGTDNNFWVINDNEGGVLPPGCGVALNGNATLHITSVFCPTCGAAYDAGGLCGILFCPETNMRAESPLINTTGYNNLTLSFDFISMGDALIDNASVWYNAGAGWNLLTASIKSLNCISGQGQWTAASTALPPATWNIPNLRIGFNWTNNDDGVGTDPSVAINNVRVTSLLTSTGGVNCTMVDSIVVTQPTPVAAAITHTNAFCSQPNGTATAVGSGGNGTFTYAWSTTPTQTTATATGLAPGIYTVTVTDILGCTGTASVTILDLPGPTLMISTTTNVSCFGGTNGAATAATTQGTAPVVIHWGTSPQQTGPQATGLAAGNYWAWATDSAGCVDSVQFTITQPILLTISTTTVGAICNLANGSATANAAGGVPNYTYTWNNGQSGPVATGLGAGVYSVTVTDGHGCTANTSVTVSQAGSPILALTTYNNITCHGGNDGSVTVSASAGVGPYTYSWNTSPAQTSATATNLTAGTYTVTVTDQNGCQDDLTITLTEPAQLVATVTATPNGCNQTVPNGTIGVSVQGGTGPYTYAWNTVPASNSVYVTGLAPGTYSVTVTDAHSCTISASGVVTQIPAPIVVAGPDVSFCEGEGGSPIFATPSSGTPGYFFNWWCSNPPCGLDSAYDDDPFANPNGSQWYYVQVTDVNGCYSNIDSLFVTVLPKPIVDAGPDIILCGDQAPCQVLHPTITGALGPYTYQWIPTNGMNNPTLLNPCVRPDTTTIYTLILTAGNGCTSDYTTTDTMSSVVVFVNPIPVADAGPDREICFGDTIQLLGTASDAGPIYDFEWSPTTYLDDAFIASPYAFPPLTTEYVLMVWSNGCPSYGDTVKVEVHTIPTVDAGWDREICPGSDTTLHAFASGDSTTVYNYHWWPNAGIVGSPDLEDIQVNPAQTTVYYVTATSSFGCESNPDSATVFVRPAPTAEAGPNLFICPGDSIQLQASYYFTTPDSAPASQIIFNWTPSGNVSDPSLLNPVVWPSVSTFYSLDIQYSVCSSHDSMLVTVGPQTMAQLLPDTTVICQYDSVRLDASGSIGTNVQWIPATGLSDPSSFTPMASPNSTTTYTLVVGEGGCDDTTSVTLRVLPAPKASYTSSLTDGCAPMDVYFTQLASGASAYIWDFGDSSPVSNQTDPVHHFATPGTYTVSLTAIAPGGCTDEIHSITVNVTDVGIAEFSSSPDFPAQLSMPNTNVVFTDESPNAMDWYWDFGDGFTSSLANPDHTFSAPGTYFVTLMIHTANGCMGEVTHGPYIVVTPDLFIPNVFSPNGDGVNDVFLVQYTGDQPFVCTVFDRWGVRLWQSTNKTTGWEGKNGKGEDVADGVYYYTAKVGNREFVGEVTLIR